MPADPVTGAEDAIGKIFDFVRGTRETMNQANRDKLDAILVDNAEFWHALFAPLRAKINPPAQAASVTSPEHAQQQQPQRAPG